MNGKKAKIIRKALGLKKPAPIEGTGGPREKDGSLYWEQRRVNFMNQYRWWKKGYQDGRVPLELINHLAHRQELRRQLDQDDQHNGE